MVAASSPFGLSKAALERRMNNQIPRKRHTPYPSSKNAVRTLPRHVARSKPKPTSTKIHTKHHLSLDPHARPEKRGTNRSRVPGTNGHGIDQWSARRILASRPHPFNPLRTQYKVHWETTWEDSSTITGLAAIEWREAVHDGNTFEFKARDGSVWTVLKDSSSLENDSEESQWEMWRAIRRNAAQELENDCFSRLKNEDFAFASEADDREVADALGEKWQKEDMCAKNVLRTVWAECSNDQETVKTDVPLGNVNVRFLAQLDPWMDEDEDDETGASTSSQRSAFTVMEIVRAVLPNPLEELCDDAFSKGAAHNHYTHWCAKLRTLICKVPFMFKSGTWMQLLAFLMLGSELFRETLSSVGVRVRDDWCQRAKEYDMHMYYDCIVDDRSTHDILETFINLRDFFRDLKPERSVEVIAESLLEEKLPRTPEEGGIGPMQRLEI